jgi:hypothetical protein
MTLVNAIFLLSLVVWIGGVVFFSFFTAPSIFHALPLEFAGKAVSAIFPKYYLLGYVSGGVALICLLISGFKMGNWGGAKLLLLAAMLGLTLANGFIIHPKARELKEQIQATTNEAELAPLKAAFGRMHRWSVIGNGIVLLLGLGVIVLTARKLQL